MGNLNLKNIRQSCTISMLDVRNNIIKTRFTVKSKFQVSYRLKIQNIILLPDAAREKVAYV